MTAFARATTRRFVASVRSAVSGVAGQRGKAAMMTGTASVRLALSCRGLSRDRCNCRRFSGA